MHKDLNIAVLSGGPGSERLISQASAQSVANAITDKFKKVTLIDIKNENFEIPKETDIAFNLIHGTFGEDGQLQKILENVPLAYTGAGIESSKIAFNKLASKKIFIENNVATPKFITINSDSGVEKNTQICQEFGLPIVIKPEKEGSSVGVHIIKEKKQLKDSLEDVFKYGSEALVEQFIEGRELTLGIVDNKPMSIVEIIPNQGFYDINNKYPWLNKNNNQDDNENVGSTYICPANIEESITKKIQALALKGHKSLNVEIYSRVDVLLDKNNNAYVLEINTIPGMTETSLLPKSAQADGINFTDLCCQIINLSFDLRKS